MKKKLLLAALAISMPVMASAKSIVKFETMYGVDGPFVGGTQIRGVLGDELPWTVKSATGSLSTTGDLKISVKGLVFTDDPIVPPELRGINDEKEFRALVSCVSETDSGGAATTNILTSGFPATKTGNSEIHAKVKLPDACVAPIIFVMSGSENKWFSVMGFEMPKPKPKH